jgi:hypothetical protein
MDAVQLTFAAGGFLTVSPSLAPAVAAHPFYGWRLLWHSAGPLRGCLGRR